MIAFNAASRQRLTSISILEPHTFLRSTACCRIPWRSRLGLVTASGLPTPSAGAGPYDRTSARQFTMLQKCQHQMHREAQTRMLPRSCKLDVIWLR